MTLPPPDSTRRRRGFEFVGFFWILPILVAAFPSDVLPPIPVLWAAAIACLILLRRDDRLDRRTLWGGAGVAAGIPGVLGRFLIFAPLLAGFAWLMEPEWFLKFPRNRTGAWAAVMVLYPLLSVVPQGIVFRTFVCHRYRPLFGSGVTMWLVAGTTFGFAHVVMHRWEPVVITIIGGVIFTSTLLRRRSGLLADLEHAMYGDLAFTLGLGVWIYSNAARQSL